jgi:sterol desaturase/sphingolipid hydroxylase (fatty acid hydroxylase superfamily)
MTALLHAVPPLALLAVLPMLYLDRALGGRPSAEQDELGTNLTLGAITLLSDGAILAGFALLYSALAPHAALIAPPPFWGQLAIAIVAGDLLVYWHHRLLHRLPWLWASHIVHHQSRRVDLGTGLRNHPFGTITSCLFWSPLLLAGIAPSAMILAGGLIGTWVVLIHRRDSVWYPALPPPFPFLLNLPAHHRAHHERCAAGACNYGLLLVVWDRLFGTYREPDGAEPVFGLAGSPATGPLDALLWDEWRNVIGRAPGAPRRPRPIGIAAGVTGYLAAVVLLALVTTIAAALRG